MRILKYKLELKPAQGIEMPRSAEILDVQRQGPDVVMWAKVNEYSTTTMVSIKMFVTGEHISIDFDGDYIGTVQIGSFVAHYFVD